MSFPEIPGEPLERVVVVEHHHHYHSHTAPIRHGWTKHFIRDLETNPHSQFTVHKWGAVYWLVNFPVIIALYIFLPTLWLKLGIFITLIYSIYANFATDYGAMSAAMAAFEEVKSDSNASEPNDATGQGTEATTP